MGPEFERLLADLRVPGRRRRPERQGTDQELRRRAQMFLEGRVARFGGLGSAALQRLI